MKNKYSVWLSIQSSLTLHFMSFCCLSKGEAKPKQFVGWEPARRFPGVNSSHTDPLNILPELFIHSNWERNVCQPGTQLLAQGFSSIPSWILKNDNCESQRKLKQEAEKAREGRTEQQEWGSLRKSNHIKPEAHLLFARVRWSWKILRMGLSQGRVGLLWEMKTLCGTRVFERNWATETTLNCVTVCL